MFMKLVSFIRITIEVKLISPSNTHNDDDEVFCNHYDRHFKYK